MEASDRAQENVALSLKNSLADVFQPVVLPLSHAWLFPAISGLYQTASQRLLSSQLQVGQ